jgi:hypothetical protein
MLDLKYIKEYSFRNKKSTINQVVLDKLNQLRIKSLEDNEMRINVFNRVTLNFPYGLEIIQKDINEKDALIKIKIRVKLHKMFILYIITSIVFGLVLGSLTDSYLVLIPLFLNVLLFYYIGKLRVSTYTEKMVEGWFKMGSL